MAAKLKPEKVDIAEKDAKKRAKKLRVIVDKVLKETDPDPKRKAGESEKDWEKRKKSQRNKRNWIAWHFMYIMWHESLHATKRKQMKKGPGRGLMQFEPATIQDLLKQYILPNKPASNLKRRKRIIRNLANAAGVKCKEMEEALEAFAKSEKAKANGWPGSSSKAGKLEKWLLESDTFAIKLMRCQFKRYGAHRFPGDKDKYEGKPQVEKAKEAHAEGWAEWWKKKFKATKDCTEKEVREKKKKEFKGNAENLDKKVKDPKKKVGIIGRPDVYEP
ncbi:MAG: hypothetical protein V3T03_06935 [Candidatus Bipolaricaulota bacterium]